MTNRHLAAFAKSDVSQRIAEEYRTKYATCINADNKRREELLAEHKAKHDALIAEEQRRLQQESKKWSVDANERLTTLERNLILSNVTLASVTTVFAAYLVYLDSK